jgi:hypothetical protein
MTLRRRGRGGAIGRSGQTCNNLRTTVWGEYHAILGEEKSVNEPLLMRALAKGGFRFTRVVPTESAVSIVESVPA